MASVPISVAYVNHLHTDTSPGEKKSPILRKSLEGTTFNLKHGEDGLSI